MTNQEHPCADILHAIADGKTVQFLTARHIWIDADADKVLRLLPTFGSQKYRVKPTVININGTKVPEPMRVAPPMGDKYFLADVTGTHIAQDPYEWDDVCTDQEWLKAGICHSTPEAAQAHIDALLSFTRSDE